MPQICTEVQTWQGTCVTHGTGIIFSHCSQTAHLSSLIVEVLEFMIMIIFIVMISCFSSTTSCTMTKSSNSRFVNIFKINKEMTYSHIIYDILLKSHYFSPEACSYNKFLSAHLPVLTESTLWPHNKCYLVRAPVRSYKAAVVFEPSSAPRSNQAYSSVPPGALLPARHNSIFVNAGKK